MSKTQHTFLSIMVLCLMNISLVAQKPEPPDGDEIVIGTVINHYSKLLQENREYRVLLPPSYQSGERSYLVVYVLDGQAYFLSAYSAMRALSGLSNMPEAIIIAVSNPERRRDMSPREMAIPGVNNGRGADFLAYLADELIPEINQNYRTLPLRVLIGHSHGALFNLYALTVKPEAFRWHLALDAPVHLDNHFLEKRLTEFRTDRPQHKGRLAVGWSRYGWSKKASDDFLQKQGSGLNIMTIDLPGENHSSMYHMGMYKGLKQLFRDHEYKHDKILTIEELDARYKSMNEEYGYEIPIPIWALRYGALEHLVSAEPDMARPFVERLEKLYGSAKVMDDDARGWLNTLERQPPKESREEYITRRNASPDEVKAYLGAWKNEQYTIEIYEVDNQLQGKLTQVFPGGENMEIAFTKFLKMEDGSLELSHQNGMPPLSGLLVYRLAFPINDAIQAERSFKVYWPRMESQNIPVTFALTRK